MMSFFNTRGRQRPISKGLLHFSVWYIYSLNLVVLLFWTDCVYLTVWWQVSSSIAPQASLCGWAVMTPSPRVVGSGWMLLRSDTFAGLQVSAKMCLDIWKSNRFSS